MQHSSLAYKSIVINDATDQAVCLMVPLSLVPTDLRFKCNKSDLTIITEHRSLLTAAFGISTPILKHSHLCRNHNL